ncbi:hypothetical protein [Halalkalirubrum salinum]|uniref:hypothetical protein n=1 Tax=Halalkalirubrum salinum TaxID=2563889 RepID=UPI0010FAEB92|nr:hypothetical protein [Halalkalirubrum salinum]
MVDYLVELKDSVFREIPLAEGDFTEYRQIAFDSKADAEAWVTEQNCEHERVGELTLHTAHPANMSDVDTYVVFQPGNGVWVPDS